EQGYRDFKTGGQFSGLQDLTRGVALDGGFGVFDGTNHGGGQLNGDRAAFIEHHFDRHAFFQVVQGVAHVVGFDFVLVVLFVHEDVHGVSIVGISAFFTVQQNDFELFVGLVDGFAGGAGQQVLELQLADSCITARLVVFILLNDERLV